MSMSSDQVKAFKASTGGVDPSTMLTAIALTLAMIYLLWMAWIAYSQFRSWQAGQGTFYDLIFNILRAAIVALMMGFIITK